ncbi:hypothetical protein [Herbidospora cretacea]|nr:hypothetical protein [Herbidospora cretacea]
MAIITHTAAIAVASMALIAILAATYLYSRDTGRRGRALRLLRLLLRR